MRKIRKCEDLVPPKGIEKAKWEWAFRISNKKAIVIFGWLEAILFFISFSIGKPDLIGWWLAFKVASKWETWALILKVPEGIDGVDPIEYVGAKNRVASNLLQRWLIGTIGNIFAGLIGAGGMKAWLVFMPMIQKIVSNLQ